MFAPDALRALNEGDLSDLELSSDDEEQFGFTSERELRSVRVGADVINHNQREAFPPDSDDDEGPIPDSSWIGMNDQEPEIPDSCNEEVPEVPPTTEVETSNENILRNVTPKQNIRWRHRKLVNTISTDWFPPISVDPRVEAPVDYYYRYVPKQLFVTMAEMTNLYATFSNRLRFNPTTAEELEILFDLYLATGIFGYPCLKMFWETNISIPLFSENMSRDRFFELRNNLHLIDNTKVPAVCNDAFYKVRPIFDAVRNRCLELPLEKELCVDEQIVPFTGKHVASST